MNNRISHIVPVLLPILASLLLSPRQLHAQTADAATACQPAAHQHQVCTDPLNDAQDVVLQPGQSLTRALAGGAAHTYQIAAEPGQYLRVVVDQQGVDVLVRLRGPATNMQIDSPIGPFGPERLSAIVPQDAIVPATYRVEVQATGTQPTGCYEITCEPLEQATARDEKQLMGDQAFSAAVGSLEHASDLKTVQGVIGKYEEALANFRDAKDRYGEAAALTGSAFQYGRIGRADTALEYLGLALPIWRALGDQRREAQIYNNSGTLYLQRSEIGFALDCYLRSVPLWCVTGERLGEATALNNIGSVYTEVGDYQTAITYYNRALEMLKGIPDSESQQASTLNNIGLSHVSLQQLDEALTCYSRALEIRRTSPGSDPLRVAQLIANVGFANFFKGDLIAADRAFKESLALRLHKDRAGEASCLYGIGLVYKSRGDLSAALDRFRDALEINRQIHDRVREAITLYAIAGIERDLADISAAYTDVRDAVTIIEELGRSLTNDELRTAYLSSVQDIYRLDIDVLMQMHQKEPKSGYDAAAFKVSEQARARVFLDLLAATRIKVENGVDPALSKQELSLSASLNALANQYTRILSITHTTQQEAALKAQLETTNTQLQQTRARIRQASPRYADLRDPRVIGVEEVQHEVLDDDTVLLEYCLDAQRSFLWMVTKTSMSSYVLAAGPDIERTAKLFYAAVAERGRDVQGEGPSQRAARIEQADQEATKSGDMLASLLLGQVAPQLGTYKLIIVTDGALQYLPFAALPSRSHQGEGLDSQVVSRNTRTGEAGPASGTRPLVLDHEIIMMPSASALASLLANLKGRSPAPNDVAVFADPVYSADDARLKTPRLEGQGHKESGSAQPAQEDALLDISRAAQDFSSVHGTIHFPRLASSGWEGQKIYDLAPAGKRLIALDFDASHEKAKKPALSEYKIVHFSAHGLIDDVHPELSAIVLSLVDGHGRAIDGFLRLQEIYNLNLPAELVMLNACETGLGEQVRGEGLVGLTRGFMYAGAARVIVTNWTMRDRAAAVFAVRFYGKLLSNHASALRALHETQVEMATRSDLRQWRAPYFWSGYTFMGVQ